NSIGWSPIFILLMLAFPSPRGYLPPITLHTARVCPAVTGEVGRRDWIFAAGLATPAGAGVHRWSAASRGSSSARVGRENAFGFTRTVLARHSGKTGCRH